MAFVVAALVVVLATIVIGALTNDPRPGVDPIVVTTTTSGDAPAASDPGG